MSLVDYLRTKGFPEEVDGDLFFHPVPPKCAVCDGLLVGSEVRWGSCGHCGGRSIFPKTGDSRPPDRSKR